VTAMNPCLKLGVVHASVVNDIFPDNVILLIKPYREQIEGPS
jgi:hypothetical protein